MKPLVQLSTALAAIISATTIHATPQVIQCPAEISPQAITVAAPAGWQPYASFPLPLFGAGMSAGAPDSEAHLRGEPLDAKGAKTLYELGGITVADGKWLDCLYGRSGEMQLSRRLDDRTRRCTISHGKAVEGEPRRIDIRCE